MREFNSCYYIFYNCNLNNNCSYKESRGLFSSDIKEYRKIHFSQNAIKYNQNVDFAVKTNTVYCCVL